MHFGKNLGRQVEQVLPWHVAHHPGGLPHQVEALAAVHRDAALLRGNPETEAPVDAALGHRQGGHGNPLVPGTAQIVLHHLPEDAEPAVVRAHRHGRNQFRTEHPARADVQVLAEALERGHRPADVESGLRGLPVHADEFGAVRDRAHHGFRCPLGTAPGVVEAVGHGLQPGHRGFVTGLAGCHRMDPAELEIIGESH